MLLLQRLNRRNFLAATTATLAVPAVHSFGQEPAAELRIGIAADAQFAEVEANGARHYREGDNRLADAVQEFNNQQVDCCFHLGDLIDRDFGSFSNCLESLKPLKVPCHHVLGNHDFDVADEKKADVPKRMGLKSNYYSRTLDKFRFIMLDGTEVSTYRYAKESDKHQAAEKRLAELTEAKTPNGQPWNGGIGNKQIKWLDSQLAEASQSDERAILICHYPVFPVNPHNLWNDKEILEVIDKHPCVAAWFNGHNHAGHYGERNGVHFVTMNGMVEHAESNAFGVATVGEAGIKLKGYGRQPDRELKFRAPVNS